MVGTDPAQDDADTGPRVPRPPLGTGYWRLWTASGVSNLADGLFEIALPLSPSASHGLPR
jgi:hypothetical protein